MDSCAIFYWSSLSMYFSYLPSIIFSFFNHPLFLNLLFKQILIQSCPYLRCAAPPRSDGAALDGASAVALRWSRLRSEVNSELNFPPKLRGARSRLYRRRFLQVNARWKALAEIYTMHSFAPFYNLNFSSKIAKTFSRLN